MDPGSFNKTYQAYCHQNAHPTRAVKEKAYLYSDLKHFGLSMGQINAFTRKHKSHLLSLSKPQAISLVRSMWSKRVHEFRMQALNILNLHTPSLTPQDLPLIETLMRESRGWVYLDNLIIPLMPHLLTHYPQTHSYLKKWNKDSDFWVRRSALLAQLLLFRQGSRGDRQLFFTLAASQLDEAWIDKHYPDPLQKKRAKFFLRKAIGWTLREMSAKDPDSVVTFVNQHKQKLSGLSYREATRKLRPESKKHLL